MLTTSNDLTFKNDAETVKVGMPENPPKQHRGTSIRYFPVDDAEEVEITPSTGDNRSYVAPTIVGIISLLILGAGLFVIKKIVIDNK